MFSKISWLTPNLIKEMQTNLFLYGETPDYIAYQSPDTVSALDHEYMYRISSYQFPSLLLQEMDIMSEESALLKEKLNHFHKINIFDLCQTTGTSALPLIYDLLEAGRVENYVSATRNDVLNKFATERLAAFVMQSQLPKIKFNTVNTELELNDFREDYLKIQQKSQNSKETIGNLFLLLDSRLGNSIDPANLLKNIYQTMDEGDCLIISQRLDNSADIHRIVQNYAGYFSQKNNFIAAKQIANLFSPEEIQVKWYEDNDFQGVKAIVETQEKVDFAKISLQAKKEIAVFRSSVFNEVKLRYIFKQTGFKIREISYGEDGGMAMFCLKK